MRLIVISLLNLIFDLLYLFFIIRVFLQYLPQNRYTKLFKPVYKVTEPSLEMIRRGVPPAAIGFDASSFIAILLLYILQQLLAKFISLF